MRKGGTRWQPADRARAWPVVVALLAVTLLGGPARAAEPVKFRPVDIYLDSGAAPLAAYQVEIVATGATIVGVEGGEAEAFRAPPYYDPRALTGGRIKLAAFQTRGPWPTGRTRVATLHMSETGPATYTIRPVVAADADGERIDVTATAEPRE